MQCFKLLNRISKSRVGAILVMTALVLSGTGMNLATASETALTRTRVSARMKVSNRETLGVYVYDQNGNLQDVTGSTSIDLPHVFDIYGNLLGTIGSDNGLYDLVGNRIGYIAGIVAPISN